MGDISHIAQQFPVLFVLSVAALAWLFLGAVMVSSLTYIIGGGPTLGSWYMVPLYIVFWPTVRRSFKSTYETSITDAAAAGLALGTKRYSKLVRMVMRRSTQIHNAFMLTADLLNKLHMTSSYSTTKELLGKTQMELTEVVEVYQLPLEEPKPATEEERVEVNMLITRLKAELCRRDVTSALLQDAIRESTEDQCSRGTN